MRTAESENTRGIIGANGKICMNAISGDLAVLFKGGRSFGIEEERYIGQ